VDEGMNVRTRIMAIRLMDKINAHPDFSQSIGVSAEMKNTQILIMHGETAQHQKKHL